VDAKNKSLEIRRHAFQYIDQYKDKILILTGARQTGKTWLCLKAAKPNLVLNFDLSADRKQFKQFENLPSDPPYPVIFVDEIHKLRGWRNYLKGFGDKFKNTRFIVSGSSAFELLCNDRGDSLAGRTITIRIEPVTFREYLMSLEHEIDFKKTFPNAADILCLMPNPYWSVLTEIPQLRNLWERYYQLGGFPELLSHQDTARIGPWLREYMQALLTRDLKDLAGLKDVDRVEQTLHLLLESIGSIYSMRSIAEVLQCSPNTIKSDILALRKLLWGFELPASHVRKSRQIQTGKKFYPVDWILNHYSNSQDVGSVFETAIIASVHRHLSFQNFSRPSPLMLSYFRNYQKEELDLIIQDHRKIYCAIEIKNKAKGDDISKTYRLVEQVKAPYGIVVTGAPGVFEYYREKILHVSAEIFLASLY